MTAKVVRKRVHIMTTSIQFHEGFHVQPASQSASDTEGDSGEINGSRNRFQQHHWAVNCTEAAAEPPSHRRPVSCRFKRFFWLRGELISRREVAVGCLLNCARACVCSLSGDGMCHHGCEHFYDGDWLPVGQIHKSLADGVVYFFVSSKWVDCVDFWGRYEVLWLCE